MAKNIFDLDHKSAEVFFYKSESYYDGELPKYFHFTKMLWGIRQICTKHSNNINICDARNVENVNYDIYINKDGRYAWRKLQLMNPVLYVDFVTFITQKDNWDYIRKRVKKLHANCKGKIICTSIPVVDYQRKKSVKASQISEWWKNVEQNALKHGLEFSYVYTTDIADCYPSIYTHSIPWALHNKSFAKIHRELKYTGNKIDQKLRNMQYGQTNGIPQGSVVMAVIAEILLAYIDRKLYYRLKRESEDMDYKIIRYRDDYKIFVNSEKDGEIIIKKLTLILLEFNLKLNSAKTKFYDDIILASIKSDKYAAIQHENTFLTDNIQNNLIRIHKFLDDYPCSNQMVKKLLQISDKILENIELKKTYMQTNRYEVFIGICTQIAYKNPTLCATCCRILSILISQLQEEHAKDIFQKIYKKFTSVPHSSVMNMFLQRMSIPYDIEINFNEKICEIVTNKINNKKSEMQLWDFDWLKPQNQFKSDLLKQEFIIMSAIKNLTKNIDKSEIDIFSETKYWSN